MNKRLVALFAALLTTACIGGATLMVGWEALVNTNGVTAANSPAQANAFANSTSTDTSANTGGDSSAQIQQLQSLVAQYQSREQQYQAREQQYQQQIDAEKAQVQQAQQLMQQIQRLLNALQDRGLITITSDGQVFINSLNHEEP
jgi:cysteinyl-tRNA synthetase